MTPSDAHQERIEKDAGHDAMQLGVLRYFRAKPDKKSILGFDVKRSFLAAEVPVVVAGRIHAFVDILQIWREIEGSVARTPREFVEFYELKPKIYSAGAFARQLHVLHLETAQQFLRDYRLKPRISVVAVMSATDVKADDFREIWDGPCLLWNGENFVDE